MTAVQDCDITGVNMYTTHTVQIQTDTYLLIQGTGNLCCWDRYSVAGTQAMWSCASWQPGNTHPGVIGSSTKVSV